MPRRGCWLRSAAVPGTPARSPASRPNRSLPHALLHQPTTLNHPITVQREIDGIFRRMLLEGASAKQQEAPLTAAALPKLPRYRKVEQLIKSYLGNTLHLLGGLVGG